MSNELIEKIAKSIAPLSWAVEGTDDDSVDHVFKRNGSIITAVGVYNTIKNHSEQLLQDFSKSTDIVCEAGGDREKWTHRFMGAADFNRKMFI